MALSKSIGNLIVHHQLRLLNFIALLIFIIVVARMGFPSKEIMFVSEDSVGYLEVANWLFGGADTDYISIRPILYPLLLKVLMSIGGVWAVWVIQAAFWFASVNLIYLSIQRITFNNKAALFGGLICAFNISVLSLTYHALSETLAIFLVSLFTYIIAKNFRENRVALFHGMLLMLVLLALVKPVFFILALLCIIIALPVYMIAEYKRHPSQLIKLFLILIPLVIQLGIMISKYDVYNVSDIGGTTFKYYLFAQTYSVINNLDIEVARTAITPYTKDEILDYIGNNFGAFIDRYWLNIQQNINSGAVYLYYPIDYPILKTFMSNANHVYSWIHSLSFIPIVLISLRCLVQDRKKLILISCLAIPLYYIIFSSGVAYSQGDRLVILCLPLWIVLYTQVYMEIANLSKEQKINLLKLKFK